MSDCHAQISNNNITQASWLVSKRDFQTIEFEVCLLSTLGGSCSPDRSSYPSIPTRSDTPYPRGVNVQNGGLNFRGKGRSGLLA